MKENYLPGDPAIGSRWIESRTANRLSPGLTACDGKGKDDER